MTDSMIAIITVFSASRMKHLERQIVAIDSIEPALRPLHIVVCLDRHEPDSSLHPYLEGLRIEHVPPGEFGFRVARARNVGAAIARAAGCRLMVFLDVDCIPGAQLIERYSAAASANPRSILCGPVTYLPETQQHFDAEALVAATAPHPARAFPGETDTRVATGDEYRLFWSLSFALTAQAWMAMGGFSEEYEGYGGEDTDFAFGARASAVPLVWVGGAHAYHQHHPTSSPPWQHLDDILRNGRIFADRWGEWPMSGWIDAFAHAGAIDYKRGTWIRTG